VQQQVIQRRRAVLEQQARDLAHVVRGDPDRDRLVDPVAGVERAGAQRHRERGEHEQRDGDPHGGNLPRGAQPGPRA
jgi:hypothetical protein